MGNSGARLGLSLVGAVVGSFVGMPQLGLLVGSLLGSFLFPDKGQNSVTTGSRVAGINLTTSTYGSGLTILYGTRRVAGNVLWNAGLRENQQTDRTTQGKGGGSSQTATSYQYFWTGAIAFCEGVSARVLRLWANGTIIYDSTKPPTSYGTDNGGTWNLKAGTDFRLYTGSETQLADAALIKFLDNDGSGNSQYACPYRGISYIVFDDIPLEQFGNRIPNFEAEITMLEPSINQSTQYWTPITGTPADTAGLQGFMAVDWNRGEVYTFKAANVSDPTQQYFRRVNLFTLKEDLQRTADQINEGTWATTNPGIGIDTEFYLGGDGFLYAASSSFTQVLKINPDTLKVVGNFGDGMLHLGSWTALTGFPTIGNYAVIGMLPDRNSTPNPLVPNYRWFLLCGGRVGSGANWGILDSTKLGDPFYDYRSQYIMSDGSSFESGGSLAVDEQAVRVMAGPFNTGQAWMAAWNTAQVGFYEVSLQYTAYYDFDNNFVWDGRADKRATVPADMIDPTWIGVGAGLIATTELRCVVDTFDNSIIFMASGQDPSHIQSAYICKWEKNYWAQTGQLLWKTKLSDVGDMINITAEWQTSLLGNNRLSWVAGGSSGHIFTIDTTTGELIGAPQDWTALLSVFGAQIYDSNSNTILLMDTLAVTDSHKIVRANLGIVNGGEDALVSDIVIDICQRVGLQDTVDIDVALLAAKNYVTSFVIPQPTPATDPLSTLAQTFFFAVTESDFVLKFIPRGGSVAATVAFNKLSAISTSTNAGDYFQETRTQDVEMPGVVQVNYTDRARDYQPGTQQASRPSLPDPTMFSSDASTIDLTQCVISDSYGLQIAEKTIYIVWQERSNYVTKISWEFIYLDPTDIVAWTLADGSEYLARIAKADIGADLTQSISSNSEDTAHYSASGRISDPGLGFPQQLPPSTSATRLFLFDLPLLRDTDDQGRLRSTAYWCAAGFGNLNWPGCNFYISQTGQSFDYAGISTVEAKYGFAQSALADANPYVQDNTNTLTVAMRTQDSDLASCTYLELVNGANAALLVNQTTLEVEIIQYQSAVHNSDGTWGLTGLLRGRRGTDPFTGIHQTGDLFIPLNFNNRAFQSFNDSLGVLGLMRDYRAVGFGQLFENGDNEVRTLKGADLLPYAPTNLKAVLSGSDIDLSWTRRTRINGAWQNFTGTIPLNEDTESYEVDILSGPGGTVKRTLTSVVESVTYLAADIATDFGSTPSHITANVYQISAQIGRGRHRELTVDVV